MMGIKRSEFLSLSARRAWIEILKQLLLKTLKAVALRKESVDRNIRRCLMSAVFLLVALRKESVDRNTSVVSSDGTTGVALRKESVDRNIRVNKAQRAARSLSARRAWIEMLRMALLCSLLIVALRKESVDRNLIIAAIRKISHVALRKESVDRNIC